MMARGGGPGGMDMNALLKQAKQMQAEMAKAQEQLANEEVEASAGGGMVKVKMSGDLRLKSIEIDPEAVDPEDVEMLADMVTAAVNEALRSAQELATSKMGGITGGLGGLGMAGPGGEGRPGTGGKGPPPRDPLRPGWRTFPGCRGTPTTHPRPP